MRSLDRISVDPNIRLGKPCARGTRMTVADILGCLAGGMSEAELLADFPQLTEEDIRACLTYAAEREQARLVQMSMKTSAPTGCCTVALPQDRNIQSH